MTKLFNKKQIGLAAACALALGVLSGAVHAQSDQQQDAKDGAYVGDTRNAVIKSGFGLCWRSASGPSPWVGPECDPNYVAHVAPPAVELAPVALSVTEAAPVAPPVVFAPPAQAAALIPPPVPKPVHEWLNLDADTLFDFDKATLRPTGLDTLDGFVSKLGDISPETITTIGHTDRIGTDRYNQRLSEQRVAAVKAYMVSKGVEPSRVNTEGKGETEPVTKAEDCAGPKSAKLIACLQPDRRVAIEVFGARIVR